MKYALGNMLNGAGGLNADQLALDLQFAADKTLTARKGPTPVLTRGSSATFVGSNGLIQSAGNNVARFDHDPVTLASRGLLIEEGRTNLFTQSETWQTGASFTGPTAPTVTNDTTTSPDGLLTADTLSGSTGTAIDGGVTSTWRQPNISSATAYTFSIYVRSLGVATKAEIRIRDNSTGASVQTLDTSLTSSWKRLSVTATTGATTTSIRCIIQNTDGPIAIWGAQLEAGSFATSYIPTTASALARSADVCNIANTASFWNSSEFTVLTNANFVTSGVDAYASNFQITAGFFGARRPNTNLAAGIIRSSGVNADISFGANGSFTTGSMRMSLAHSTGQQAGSLNGATAIQQNSAFVPSSNPIFNIGASNQSAGSAINGHIVAIRYYRKRLANAKLQAITA
jgi:hypothetical protein